MIQRLRFASRRADVDEDRFESNLRTLAEVALAEPPEVRPVRATVSIALEPLLPEPPRHHGVLGMWFTDAAHLARFESVLAGAGAAGPAGELFDSVADIDGSPSVVAESVVVRGEPWLAERWSGGRLKVKHLALALRADGLARTELSSRWRAHAGSAGATPIPDEARGAAYVQDHPVLHHEWDPAYDAISEVWFDDVTGLQQRIDWFAANRVGQLPDDLFRRSWFLAVREEVIGPPS